MIESFNTQPPEGGCLYMLPVIVIKRNVSTHSRPKAAAYLFYANVQSVSSFNTQPPEGGCFNDVVLIFRFQSFNTQPPEGGCSLHKKARKISVLNTVFR